MGPSLCPECGRHDTVFIRHDTDLVCVQCAGVQT